MPITTKAVVFGGSIDLPLRRPDPFNPLVLSEFANRVAEVLLLPIQADQFRVRIGDALYWYELVGSFLGDNVQFKKTAERATLIFKNGRVSADVQFIGVRTDRFIEAFVSGAGQQVILTAFCHASCASLAERDRFLSPFAIADSVSSHPVCEQRFHLIALGGLRPPWERSKLPLFCTTASRTKSISMMRSNFLGSASFS
jgi:hypothetical protein